MHHTVICTGRTVSVSSEQGVNLEFKFSDDRGACLVYDMSEKGTSP